MINDPADGERARRWTSERWFRLLIENTSDIVALLRPDGHVKWVSRSFGGADAYDSAVMVGTAPWELVHPDDRARTAAMLTEITDTGRLAQPVEVRFRVGDDAYHWVSVRGRLVDDGVGEELVISLRDVDDIVRAREALAESERRFRLAMHGNPTGMALVDLERRFMSVNPALCAMLQREPAWFESSKVDDVLHPDDRAADRDMRIRVLAGEREDQIVERRLVAADGSSICVLHSIGLLRDQDQRPLFYVCQFQDISARKAAESSLEFAATHDPLTGLSNRANLVEEIQRALGSSHRSGRLSAVVMLDLDHFKFVNDSLGHAVGDELLRVAAQRIRATVREGDLVARQGGDEFVVVMRDLDDPTEAVRVAQRIVEVFRTPVHIASSDLYTTASVGVAISDFDTDADTLLGEADTAMYVAKDDGRDRYSLFNDELRAVLTERLRIESGLRQALERHEFDVWFQPEVDLVSGRVAGVEALLRWHHPGGDVYAAERFIEVAEDSGMIVEIGAMVIRRSCAQAAEWNQGSATCRVVIRVNLSTRQLAEGDLLSVIDDALATTGALPSCLCFEITETAIMRDLPVVSENLRGIHSRGIMLALDDFGTGYASLTYLREIPIGALKLDRSFVAGIAENHFDRQLVAGVIGLAHGLDITVIAEGVEDERQAEILRSLGCRRAQGFLFSPAISAGQLDELLDRANITP